ncbi:MAG: metallophosphoesterase family protein [Cyanobacteria bacterium SZAS-4]|nr:metallophosphoesterase family protein [Cyanobacteria bacterium SZAS-4]
MEDLIFILVVGSMGLVFAICLRASFAAYKAGFRNYRFKVSELFCFFFGLVGLFCFAYGLYEPYTLEVSKIQIQSSKLVHGKELRIVHLSDLHSDGIERLESRLPSEIAKLHPDLIVFTGDSANNRDGLKLFRKFIAETSEIAPTYAVYGNHDSRGGRDWDIYGQTGVHLLNGNIENLDVRGTKVFLTGIAVDNEYAINKALAKVPHEAFSIFLYHYPAGVDAAVANNVDLFCCGHTHGGQVRLPFYGAVVTNSLKGKQYEAGLYKVNRTSTYVSRGIGMIGLPIRFMAPPEIAVIEVQSAN